MAYLGNAPARSFISFERQVFTIVNSQTAYTLSHSVNNENDIRLVVNNIVQEPGSGKAYTASGTTLTLSAALTNGTDEMYCVFLGRATATNAPGAGSVTNTKISYPLAQSGAVVSTFNRTSSDGNILELQKDGTTVGSVASMSGANIQIGSGDVGLRFFDTSDAIYPVNNGTSLDRDNAIDLGRSGVRFKDLYLSGGAFLGGTGTANQLDDYEEGTFTPAFDNGTSGGSYDYQVGEYTKIGNICFFQIQLDASGMTGTTGQLRISGLPFTSDSGSPYGGAIINYNANFRSDGDITAHVGASATKIWFYQNSGSSLLGTEATDINASLLLNGFYRTA